jgi:hypothetical protein
MSFQDKAQSHIALIDKEVCVLHVHSPRALEGAQSSDHASPIFGKRLTIMLALQVPGSEQPGEADLCS